MSMAKSPGLIAFLIGNPISLLGIVGGGGWYLYHWWDGTAPMLFGISHDWMALICVVMIFHAVKAGKDVTEHWEWKRNWYAMQGMTPPSLMGFLRRIPGIRWLLGAALWVGATYYLSLHPHDKDAANLLSPVVLGLPLLAVLGFVFRITQRLRRHIQRRRRVKPVQLCRSRPRRRTTVAQAYAALPDRCRKLLDEPPPT